MRHYKAIIVVILLAGTAWFFGDKISSLPQVQELSATVANIEKNISAPDPLRIKDDSDNAFLTRAGVVKWTNEQRVKNGLSVLATSSQLNSAASARLNDMFARQYFAHVAPDGRAAADEVDEADYEYIALGENLALGNFENDEALVQAWMDSPGHRANIVSDRFTEIGVAVGQGKFEGENTWLAVQIFARPRSACPIVDENLKSRIAINEAQLDQMQIELKAKRQALENTSPKRGDEYNAKVAEYNLLVNKYNQLLSETKRLITDYNAQAAAYNVCLND